MVPAQEQDVPLAVAAEVLLPLYLRILLQPLRDDLLPDPDAVQTADRRLARVCAVLLRAGAGRQRISEPVCAAARGHPAGQGGDEEGGEGGREGGGEGGERIRRAERITRAATTESHRALIVERRRSVA